MLEIKNLTKIYEDGSKAVDDLSLSMEHGEIYCLLGSNGAGKSTTINMIFGFIAPTSGTITVDGIDAVRQPLKAKEKLAFVAENVMLYEQFSAIRNLHYFARIGGAPGFTNEQAAAALSRAGLPREALGRRAGKLSKGMRQKVGIAIAIAKNASVIVMDEPTSGLDPEAADSFTALVRELRDEGKTILFSSHDILRVSQVADRFGIMKSGRLLKEAALPDTSPNEIGAIYLDTVRQSTAQETKEPC